MTRLLIFSLSTGLLIVGAGISRARGETKNETPDFKEVYELIRAHAAGIDDAELNRAAVQGLMMALGSKAWLATNNAPASSAAASTLVTKATLYDDGFAYLRIARVADGLARALESAWQQLSSTNKVKGIVLDLRFAGGMDYAAGTDTADLFVAKARPLLNWGEGVVSSHEKTNSIQLPVVILANRQTEGAAEALAAVLRANGAGLILGGRTAGRAMITKGFPLKTGGELRIATAPVTLGDGPALSTDGVKPDIEVPVGPEEERAFYADAYYVARRATQIAGTTPPNPAGGTNTPPRRTRFNEAELVREHREGMDRDPEESPRQRPPEPDIPLVSDPVLARALDLLKGLAVVRQSKS